MRRPESVKATYEGVIRSPWSLAMISDGCHKAPLDRRVDANVKTVRTNTVILPYTDAGVGSAEIDTAWKVQSV
jgi:hypothetical protein